MTARQSQQVISYLQPSSDQPSAIAAEFKGLLRRGAKLLPAGSASDDPDVLLRGKYLPQHKITLFDTHYYLAPYRFDASLNFFVAYVAIEEGSPRPKVRRIHPRIFYKDSSLTWRVASHLIDEGKEHWIGKGDVRWEKRDDGDYLVSVEETTDLPYELQGAFDLLSRTSRSGRDARAVPLILKHAPPNRLRPYADFSQPRLRASRLTPMNRGKKVAYLENRQDPKSLRFAPGFDPDYHKGVFETTESSSRIYGGDLKKFRVLSMNRKIQYQFVASPTHIWANPPQALTKEMTTYGVRALHVESDDYVFIPGFEYHFIDETVSPPELYSQVPEGFVGEPSPVDPSRSDVSPWLNELPIIADFEKYVLGR